MFYKDESLITHLLAFLEQDTEVNITLAGYFHKACEILILINPEKFLTIFYDHHSDERLLYHLYSQSLSETLIKALIYSSEYSQFHSKFLKLIHTIADKLSSDSLMIATIASQILMKIIHSNYDRLYAFYASESFINILFANLSTGNNHSARAKLRVLYSMLIKSSPRRDSNFFAALTEAIPQFALILEVQPLRFSDTLMALLEIIKLLILVNNDEINGKIIEHKVLDKIQILVEGSPFCTILHNLYLGIVTNILTTNGCLSYYILNTLKISDFIVEKASNPLILMKKTKVRIGYIPHLLSIANLLLKLEEQDIRVEYTLENTAGWFGFVKDILEHQNTVESKELGICKTDIYEDSHSETDLLSEEDLKDFEDNDMKGEEKEKSSSKNDESEGLNSKIIENNSEKSETSQNSSESINERFEETKDLDFVEINLELNTETECIKELHGIKENLGSSESRFPIEEEIKTLELGTEEKVSADEDLLANYDETELLLMLVKESLDEYPNFNQVNYWKMNINTDQLEDL